MSHLLPELAETYTEYLEHGCTPPQVLAMLAKLHQRVANRDTSAPGQFRSGEPNAEWTTEHVQYRWKLSLPLYRVPTPIKEPDHGLGHILVEKTPSPEAEVVVEQTTPESSGPDEVVSPVSGSRSKRRTPEVLRETVVDEKQEVPDRVPVTPPHCV